MAHTAYLLACAGMNFYAGYTPDITRRVLLHETGRGAKYTRAHRPVRRVFTEEYATKSAAMRREAALKRLSRPEKEALCAAWAAGPDAAAAQRQAGPAAGTEQTAPCGAQGGKTP